MAKMTARGATVPIPTDVVCAKEFGKDAVATVKKATEVADDDMILTSDLKRARFRRRSSNPRARLFGISPVGVFN